MNTITYGHKVAGVGIQPIPPFNTPRRNVQYISDQPLFNTEGSDPNRIPQILPETLSLWSETSAKCVCALALRV